MKANCRRHAVSLVSTLVLLVLALAGTGLARDDEFGDGDRTKRAKTLHVWAGDQARLAPETFLPSSIVNLGENAGPHDTALTDDDKRLVVTDYFLNEDDFGKIHFEGDHHVHVIKVFKDHLELDPRFDVDFNAAFPPGPRGHTALT
ncbi:MAG TPA: hypothetical protein VN461_21180 [Vicinamibacteria bacterium]|jgi:hypothetical protein|nr:hypothetical protein [Vicinamibacteria bacterium]